MAPRMVDKPLVLYGKGKLGTLASEIFTRLGIAHQIIDRDHMHYYYKCMIAVCVATAPYQEIHKFLESHGYDDIVPVWDIIQAYPQTGIEIGWRGELADNKHFTFIAKSLTHDTRSLFDLITFWDWRMARREREDFIPLPIRFPLKSDLASMYARKKVRMSRRGDIIIIHNEGLELETIWYNRWKIIDYRPKLVVSCYHSHDGLWRIPELLFEILEDYRITFRLHAYMGLAATMYCWPEEAYGKRKAKKKGKG